MGNETGRVSPSITFVHIVALYRFILWSVSKALPNGVVADSSAPTPPALPQYARETPVACRNNRSVAGALPYPNMCLQ